MSASISLSKRRKLLQACNIDFTNNGQPLTSLSSKLLALGATFSCTSPKSYVQNGAIVTLAANTFGTTYDDVTGLYAFCPELSKTNLVTNSDGNASTYTTSNVVDGTAVPGFSNGIYFGNNSLERSATKLASVTNGTAYTISFFIIMDDGDAPVVGTTNTTGDFSLTLNGLICSGKLEKLIGSNVYRVSASKSATATASHAAGITKFTGQSSRTFRITGEQVESGSRCSSYIATVGSTVTRAADQLTIPVANISGFLSTGYTLYVDYRRDIVTTITGTLIHIDDTTVSNRSLIYVNGPDDLIKSLGNSAGAGQFTLSGPASNVARHKASVTISANSFLGAVDGVALTEDLSGNVPVSPSTLRIGTRYDGTSQANSFIFGAKLIPIGATQALDNGLTR